MAQATIMFSHAHKSLQRPRTHPRADTLAVFEREDRMTASLIVGTGRSNTGGGEARLDPEERIKQLSQL